MRRNIDQKSPSNTQKNPNILSPLKNARTSLTSRPLSLQLKQGPQI